MANVKVTFKPYPLQLVKDLTNRGMFALESQFKADCNRYCKIDSGDTMRSAHVEHDLNDTSMEIWWETKYAVYAYFTGTPNRGGAASRNGIADSGNPNAQLQWGDYAGRKHGKEWGMILEKVINSGK